MIQWIDELQALRDACAEIVLVTIAAVRGSAPREVGARMIVTPRQTLGSIGGGRLEHESTRLAVRQLGRDSGTTRFRRRFPLGANLGQCCGGVVEVLFESFRPGERQWFDDLYRLYRAREALVMATLGEHRYLVTSNDVIASGESAVAEDLAGQMIAAARMLLAEGGRAARADELAGRAVLFEPITDSDMNVIIFGAGHVGSACVAALSKLDCCVRWVDSRRKVFPEAVRANVSCVESANPVLEVEAMPPAAFYLIMTHSHPLDFDICQRVLSRDDFAYCGLIGSVSKRRRFEKLMRDGNLPAIALQRLTCPIGVAGIVGKRPAEIAVAVSAELLQIRDAGKEAQRRPAQQPSLSVVAKSDNN